MGHKRFLKIIGLGIILGGYAFLCLIIGFLIKFSYITLSFYSVVLLLIPLLTFTIITLGYIWRYFRGNFKLLSIAIVLSLLLPQLYFSVLIYDNESKSYFNVERWYNKPDERVYIVDDMLERYSLKGKTRQEIIKLLGEPTETEYFQGPNILVYYLGPERSFISIDSEWLIVDFDSKGKVKSWGFGTD